MTLLIVDTTGIQPYIFGSNRLPENIGASFLVKQATTKWAQQAAEETGGQVVYAGGGNYLVTFDEATGMPQEFIRRLSRKTLTQAPNLQLVIAAEKVESEEDLPDAVRRGFAKLAQQKRCRALPAPPLGYSVTRVCQSTGLPAVEEISEKPNGEAPFYFASAEIAAKKHQVPQANKALHSVFSEVIENTIYQFPQDFDHLGRSLGEHSFIAVVHADGNDMGQEIQDIAKQCKAEGKADEYRARIKAFSAAVNQAGEDALRDTLQSLIDRLRYDQAQYELSREGDRICLWARDQQTQQPLRILTTVDLTATNQGYYLPFRPLVFGGDDVTFVCDGRLALSLATTYLQKFEDYAQNLPYASGPLTACAGIAIVPVHYPFARAYQLAEELCHSAKEYRRAKKISKSCLDWHFAMSGLSGRLEAIRKRQYTVAAGTLHQRPVTLAENTIPGEELHAWTQVRGAATAFQQQWADKRNKLKTLREELRGDSQTVQRFLTQTNIKRLPKLSHSSREDLAKSGWLNTQCAYFDAVELADWFIALEERGLDEGHPLYQDTAQDEVNDAATANQAA
jgi:hypothetical protein